MLEVVPRYENLKESEVETMTKVKALLLSIICTVTAIFAIANQQIIPLLAFGAGAILFFSIWLYKYRRDRNIVAQSWLQNETHLTITAPPKISQGSRGLKVPPPIKQRKVKE